MIGLVEGTLSGFVPVEVMGVQCQQALSEDKDDGELIHHR